MGEWLVDLATFAARFGCFGWAEAGGLEGEGGTEHKENPSSACFCRYKFHWSLSIRESAGWVVLICL